MTKHGGQSALHNHRKQGGSSVPPKGAAHNDCDETATHLNRQTSQQLRNRKRAPEPSQMHGQITNISYLVARLIVGASHVVAVVGSSRRAGLLVDDAAAGTINARATLCDSSQSVRKLIRGV